MVLSHQTKAMHNLDMIFHEFASVKNYSFYTKNHCELLYTGGGGGKIYLWLNLWAEYLPTNEATLTPFTCKQHELTKYCSTTNALSPGIYPLYGIAIYQNTPPFLVQKSWLVGILVVLACVKQFQRD